MTSVCSVQPILAKQYCLESSPTPVLSNTDVTYIMFSSCNDVEEINLVSQSGTWIACSRANIASIFMIAVGGGIPELAELAKPSKDNFAHMDNMAMLNYEVVSKTCHCEKLSDGSLPAGCPSEPALPTTPAPTTTTAPPTPSWPPCFGDFIIVMDHSTTVSDEVFNAMTNAVIAIPDKWNLNHTDELRISGLMTGIDPDLAQRHTEFVESKWHDEVVRFFSSFTFATQQATTSPSEIRKEIETVYCKEGATVPVLPKNDVTVIIFTSWSDDAGIEEALNEKLWLSCALSKLKSVFMVAIGGGSLKLAELSIPSNELFYKLVDQQTLVDKVTSTTCNCAPTTGVVPPGCPILPID